MSARLQHDLFSRRSAGVLLHLTSLPDFYKSGLLGDDVLRFLDFLAASGFGLWQMLPVQPVQRFESPYQACSCHAGNPDFISLPGAGTRDRQTLHRQWQAEVDSLAYQRFRTRHQAWLHDYVLYCAIRDTQAGKPWFAWPDQFKHRDQSALQLFSESHQQQMDYYSLEQFVFFSQWQQMRRQAAERGIRLIGDMPIFPGYDSADVWAHRNYFKLDNDGHLRVVAGVPPDYFSATGQRWGNPVYDWQALAADRFNWWVDRLRTQLELFDLVRLDHFRGLDATWEIPAACDTAEQGRWEAVPGRALLEVLREHFRPLPLIAEDLGIVTPSVTALRQDFNLPGMVVLQFAFDSDAKNPYLPHNHEPDCIVYTGTHDNNTTVGWFEQLDTAQRKKLVDYCNIDTLQMPWPLIHIALESVCMTAILPMQDLLELDGTHRMNRPGTLAGNWHWQFQWEWLKDELPEKLNYLNRIYDRC